MKVGRQVERRLRSIQIGRRETVQRVGGSHEQMIVRQEQFLHRSVKISFEHIDTETSDSAEQRTEEEKDAHSRKVTCEDQRDRGWSLRGVTCQARHRHASIDLSI